MEETKEGEAEEIETILNSKTTRTGRKFQVRLKGRKGKATIKWFKESEMSADDWRPRKGTKAKDSHKANGGEV